jgi:hypothetical protein
MTPFKSVGKRNLWHQSIEKESLDEDKLGEGL